MCGTCGCDKPDEQRQHFRPARQILLNTSLLAANDSQADQNRRYFLDRGILAINLVAGPGAGKTRLLEATAQYFLRSPTPLHVIEGDQQTDNDARRVRKAGAIAYQINTGHLCHLEAHHVQQALVAHPPTAGCLMVVENVGNLVCPASFDLGEQLRVVVISTPEGDDKPLKYPDILVDADLLVISKCDLLPFVDFDAQACADNARRIRPGLEVLQLSAKTGDGMQAWFDWLNAQRRQFRQETSPAAPLSSDLR